jgi:hypothetical protein
MTVDSLQVVMRILDNENHLVERADQKAISLLSILGVFMVFFIVYYRVIPINPLSGVLISLYFFFALLSIISLIMTIRPRIRREGTISDNKKSVSCDPTFFTGICKYEDAAEYKESLQTLLNDEKSIIDIYIGQIFSVAKINSAKYKYVQRGVIFVITTLSIELILIVYLFFHYMEVGKFPSII